jgi:hypothetical protein
MATVTVNMVASMYARFLSWTGVSYWSLNVEEALCYRLLSFRSRPDPISCCLMVIGAHQDPDTNLVKHGQSVFISSLSEKPA